jgi:hypothetical protein
MENKSASCKMDMKTVGAAAHFHAMVADGTEVSEERPSLRLTDMQPENKLNKISYQRESFWQTKQQQIEEVCSCETSVGFKQDPRLYIPNDSILRNCR